MYQPSLWTISGPGRLSTWKGGAETGPPWTTMGHHGPLPRLRARGRSLHHVGCRVGTLGLCCGALPLPSAGDGLAPLPRWQHSATEIVHRE